MQRQITFATIEHESRKKKPRMQIFLEKMEEIIPWSRWLEMIEKALPKDSAGGPPYPAEMMLRIYLMQIWFDLSDEEAEDALLDYHSMAYFAGIDNLSGDVPDASAIRQFRGALAERGIHEKIMRGLESRLRDRGLSMTGGKIVDPVLVAAPPRSTKLAD